MQHTRRKFHKSRVYSQTYCISRCVLCALFYLSNCSISNGRNSVCVCAMPADDAPNLHILPSIHKCVSKWTQHGCKSVPYANCHHQDTHFNLVGNTFTELNENKLDFGECATFANANAREVCCDLKQNTSCRTKRHCTNGRLQAKTKNQRGNEGSLSSLQNALFH